MPPTPRLPRVLALLASLMFSWFHHSTAFADEPAPQAAATAKAPSDTFPLHFNFHHGLEFSGGEDAFHLHVGGLVQADGRYFPANTAPGPVDQVLIRRARIDLRGTVFRYAGFRIQPDFGQGKVVLYDAYAEVGLLGRLFLRAGKQKVPFGLERLQSAGDMAFLERSYATYLAPTRDVGVTLQGSAWNGTLAAQIGLFNGDADRATDDTEADDGKEMSARLFVHPLRPTGIAALHDLGLGGAVTYGVAHGTQAATGMPADRSDGGVTFFRFVTGSTADTTVVADGQRIRATGELYYYVWRLGFLGEYAWSSQQARLGATGLRVARQAYSAYATFLLTDDRASYNEVVPRRPLAFRRGGSAGAWELGFRYQEEDVDGDVFDQGFADLNKSVRTARSYAAGLNWYPNSVAKVQLDYVRTDYKGGAKGGDKPSENALLARLQVSL